MENNITKAPTVGDDDVGDLDAVSKDNWSVGGIERSPLIRAIYATICTVGIIGNLLVCVVLMRSKALRDRTSHILVHLSMVDVIVCLVVIPLNVFPYQPPMHGRLGDFICRFYVSKFLQWSSMHSSMGSLVLVNLERFVAIVYPHKYKLMFTYKKVLIMILLVWVEGIGSVAYFFTNFTFTEETGCTYNGWPSVESRIIMGIIPYLAHYVGPLTIMFAVQWKMIDTFKKQQRKITQQCTDAVTARRKLWRVQASQELQRTLFLVVITYALCWGANQTIFFLYMMGVDVDFTQPYYHAGVIFGVINSCLNPIIYTVRNKPFRKALKDVAFCRKGGSNRVVPELMSTTVSDGTA